MSKRNMSKVLAIAVALALASTTLYAGPTSEKGGEQNGPTKTATKEAKIGMATGAATGALIGGPIGAAVGFIVGAVTGSEVSEVKNAKQTAESLRQQLSDAQSELAQMAKAQQTDKDSIVGQLAQRLRADVMFRTASAELDEASTQKLSDLGKVLGAYPDLTIEIDGYADPRGKSASNDELSQQRASAVRAALIVGGASPDNIRVAAHGEHLSTAAKGDLEAYAWERRVSMSVSSTKSSTGSQVAQVK